MNKIKTLVFAFWATLLIGCGQSDAPSEKPGSLDIHSFANLEDVRATHLHLDLTVDFEQKKLIGSVELKLKPLKDQLDQVILDTKDLTIDKVELNIGGKWQTTEFELKPVVPKLGQALVIQTQNQIPDSIKVYYQTSPKAGGLQWLTPEQTGGKQHPFLFSQAQAILARSFIPHQDSPLARITYSANIKTPPNLLAVMSAKNEKNTPIDGDYYFEMKQAIPSYLIAIAVGDLKYKEMGPRTGIYAEDYILEAALAEFEDTEKMLEAVEENFGKYQWEQYDLLILPPSFPYGGMENPRLSFITPTVIAGDKSLVALIAHELAHSWTGNLITNATWQDFWLNEGFTTYLTYRIMEIIYGTDRFNMESVLGYQSLQHEVETLEPIDQVLAVDLTGREPDDAFSDIPYEKGSLFVTEIEQAIGRPTMDKFLADYFQTFGFMSITTQDFLTFADEKLIKPSQGKLTMERFKEWIYKPGLPDGHPVPKSNAFNLVDDSRENWLTGKQSAPQLDTENWTVHQWLYFLNNMPKQLSETQLKDLDSAFNLTQSKNNEIAHSWLKISIQNNYQPAYSRLESYLIEIGRRKLIKPLYAELAKTAEGKKFAERVYKIARPGYHPLAQGTMDAILK